MSEEVTMYAVALKKGGALGMTLGILLFTTEDF